MTKSKSRIIIAIILAVLALALIVTGTVYLIKRNGEEVQNTIQTLRMNSVLSASSDVETFVKVAKEEANQRAKDEWNEDDKWLPDGTNQDSAPVLSEEYKAAVKQATKLEYDEYKEKVAAKKTRTVSLAKIQKAFQVTAEAEVRDRFASLESYEASPELQNELKAALQVYADALSEYYKTKASEEEKYLEEQTIINTAEAERARAEKIARGEKVSEELIVKQVSVFDMEPTQAMLEKQAVVDEAYQAVGEKLKQANPALDDSNVASLKNTLADIVFLPKDNFVSLFDRYTSSGDGSAVEDPVFSFLLRYCTNMIYIGLALLVLTALLLYFELLNKKLGLPRIVLGTFFLLLCFLCLWFDLSLPALLSNTLVRLGMNSIMVLAMVPGIQCGISLNLGLPIGLVAGLVGGLCTIQWGIPGIAGFAVAIAVGVTIAAVAGWLYAQMLNRLKGEEMSVTTYVGFSIVSLMCIAWLVLPFSSLKLRWPMGTGLRNTIGLDSSNFKHVLDDFLSFQIGDFIVPTGALLFMALMCLLMWLFTRSKTGVAMAAVGNNPRFAEATGINVNKMRIIGTVLSTMLGAIGILVYSQSYGFMQLYTAPRQMGFVAASAILIGGATTTRGKISNVLIGTFLFQGVLTLGMPVANELVPGSTFSETLRILISNGIILYALTKSGGGSRG